MKYMCKTDDAPLTLDSINEQLQMNPFNSWLRLRMIEGSGAKAWFELPWREEMAGAPGRMHGGVLAAAIDASAFWTLASARGIRGGPTLDLRVDFHRPASGTLLLAGEVLHSGVTVSTIEVKVWGTTNTLIASGRCVFVGRRVTSS